MLATWANISVIVFMAIFSLIAVGALVGIAFALNKLQQQVDKLTAKVEPVITKASTTLDTVQRVTVSVGEKADTILTRGEALTDNVSQKIETTATVVENTVTKPLINLSSLIAGVSKGVSVYTHGGANGNSNSRRGRKPKDAE